MPTPTALPVSVPVPVPVVVVTIPTPAPVVSTPSKGDNSSGGGGSTGGVPIPQPVPIPVPVPIPNSVPTSAPADPPSNNNGGGGGGGCEGNCAPVASIHAYVYYVQCNGVAMPNTKFVTEGPADCDVRLDATPKDERGKATNVIGSPNWSIDGGYRWATPGNPYTPLVFGGRSGEITVSVEINGVRSNTFTYRFR
jgi:hypothetical protein